MNLNRIEATITPGNDGSVRVLKKLNFKQEGIVRERDFIKGKLEDGIIMALLKKDYRI
jgi:[ribosomal protein S5]-alanine N-acetyltransferase